MKAQPTQLCAALSVDSFCAALRRLSLGELGIWSLRLAVSSFGAWLEFGAWSVESGLWDLEFGNLKFRHF